MLRGEMMRHRAGAPNIGSSRRAEPKDTEIFWILAIGRLAPREFQQPPNIRDMKLIYGRVCGAGTAAAYEYILEYRQISTSQRD